MRHTRSRIRRRPLTTISRGPASDSLVGLIVLRWAAERVGVDPRPEFESLAATASDGTRELIRGIPSRSASEVEDTVKQMTAKAWRSAFGW